MSDFTAVQRLMADLNSTSDEVLLSMSSQWAEVLRQSGNSRAATYIISLPKDTPAYTAREIRNTLIQQAKISLCPQPIQLEVLKRRNDGYGMLCAQLSIHASSQTRSISTLTE
jgi:hypothetical protein